MLVGILNGKGGTGKSTLAYNLQKDLKGEWFGLTNDLSNNKFELVDKFDVYKDVNVIYDFGGYLDKSAWKVIQYLDIIIVPYLEEDCIKTNLIIDDLTKLNKDFLKVNLKQSKIMKKSIKKNYSILEYYNENKINRHHLRNFINDYKEIIKRIENAIR